MSLFGDALSLSGTRATAIKNWLARCAATSDGPTGDGVQVRRNIQRECHFAGRRRTKPTRAAYLAFLDQLARTGADLVEDYRNVCVTHQLAGEPIRDKAIPSLLYRYETHRKLCQRLPGGGRRVPRTSRAWADSLVRQWHVWESEFSRAWFKGGNEDVAVFAATEVGGMAPAARMSSLAALCAKLGLPSSRSVARFELCYHKDSVDEKRFPTVADAGWFSYFRPAAARSQLGCAWNPVTRRRGFPELVHANRRMSNLLKAPELIES